MSRSTQSQPRTETLNEQLSYLKLNYLLEHYEALASEAAQAQWTHVDYLACLIEGEALERQQRSIQRRIGLARFPVIKTLDAFQSDIYLLRIFFSQQFLCCPAMFLVSYPVDW